jgi:hypothetical protein
MKTKISNYQKTDHFIFRQWDRKLEDACLIKILEKADFYGKKKIMLIIGNKVLKEADCRFRANENMIIIVRSNLLITFFVVKDLYKYLKSTYKIEKQIIN